MPSEFWIYTVYIHTPPSNSLWALLESLLVIGRRKYPFYICIGLTVVCISCPLSLSLSTYILVYLHMCIDIHAHKCKNFYGIQMERCLGTACMHTFECLFFFFLFFYFCMLMILPPLRGLNHVPMGACRILLIMFFLAGNELLNREDFYFLDPI